MDTYFRNFKCELYPFAECHNVIIDLLVTVKFIHFISFFYKKEKELNMRGQAVDKTRRPS